jgi:hypothetical protein
LLDSQELEEFIKDDEFIPSLAQEKKKMNINVPGDASKNAGVKKGGSMEGDLAEGVRRSSRLESTEEMKIVDKAAARAMAKDAFIKKVRRTILSLFLILIMLFLWMWLIELELI